MKASVKERTSEHLNSIGDAPSGHLVRSWHRYGGTLLVEDVYSSGLLKNTRSTELNGTFALRKQPDRRMSDTGLSISMKEYKCLKSRYSGGGHA